MKLILDAPVITNDEEWTTVQVLVHARGFPDYLFFKTSNEFAYMVSERSDASALGLLLPAMLLGSDMHIEGTISERLFENIQVPLQKALKAIIPELNLITISANKISKSKDNGEGVATGFSAGIDSFCMLSDYHGKETQKVRRLSHLLFNNVGALSVKSEHDFMIRFKKLKEAADRMGLPLIPVHTNLMDFYPSSLDFVKTHTIRNATAPLALQAGLRNFFYASAYDYTQISMKPTKSMAKADPVLLPLISTESLDMMPAGSEYTRVEKTLKVANYNEARSSLDVCVTMKHGGNCSHCSKCMRTMLTLEICGKLGEFTGVFDIETYMKRRDKYIGEVLRETSHFEQEIRCFMSKMGFEPPLKSKLYSALRIPEIKWKTRKIRKLLKRMSNRA